MTKKVFIGDKATIINQYELAAVQKTGKGGLNIYLRNGTKLEAKGEDAGTIWRGFKEVVTGKAYDPDFEEEDDSW